MQPVPSSPLAPGRVRDQVVATAAEGSPTTGGVVERLRRGSRDAMSEIFADHLEKIYNYCYRRTGSWTAAEDLSSTVFLEVWRHRRRAVEQHGSMLPWLYGVATNVCRNHLRSQRRHTAAMSRLHLVEGADARAGESGDQVGERVSDLLDADRRARLVLDQLAELPDADHDAFVLVCWEGLSYAEAADALGIPIGTIRSRLSRVRTRFRLSESYGDI